MTGGSRIVAIGSGDAEAPLEGETHVTGDAAPLAVEEAWDDAEGAIQPRIWPGLVWPALAILAVLGWTGFFGWANRASLLQGSTPAEAIALIRDWTGPVLLVCAAWLIAMRNSRREAARFGDTARLLSDEANRLESRLTTVNRELSLAREFIAAQSRDLEALGRTASERLGQNADRLAALIQDNGARIDTIGTVSETALDNMEKLRSQLPVIASSAKDVTNNIGNAGRTAHTHLEDMIAGFNKLNQFGQASERQVLSLRGMIDEALREFSQQATQLDEITSSRFAALAERGAEFRTLLESQEVEALAAIRSRASALTTELEEARSALDTQEAESLTSLRARLGAVRDESAAIGRSLRDGESAALEAWRKAVEQLEADLRTAIAEVGKIDAQAMESAQRRLAGLAAEAEAVDERMSDRDRLFAEELERRQLDTDTRHGEVMARLHEQLATLDAAIAERHAAQEEHSRKLVHHSEAIAAQLGSFGGRMAEIAEHGSIAEAAIAASLTTLAEKLLSSREALTGTDTLITGLTDSSVRLLELIQASVQHSSVDLPAAMDASETRLAALEQRAIGMRDVVQDAEARGSALSDYVIATRGELGHSLGELDSLHTGLGTRTEAQATSLAELRQTLQAVHDESLTLAEQAQSELRLAIEALSGSARDAVAGIEQMSAASVKSLAQRLGQESQSAIEQAMRAQAAESVGQLEQAAAHAAGVSREAAIQLRDQLAKVNELAGNLERRVAQARSRAEDQVDNDFARRVALITESLNSNAIDIARALDTDVTDTAWSSYLKGDRGVFTRRAVRLLEPAEAKAVSQIYENDRDFRDHVSRYIHDFEAMLRQLLSTRDGHALGVTLLSSDMGKLYVALAQSIARLRA